MLAMLARSSASRVLRLATNGHVRTKFAVPSASDDQKARERRRRLKPKLPKNKFAAMATAFLDRVETAMEPLAPPVNQDFNLLRDGDVGLTIRSGETMFEIEVAAAKQQLRFTSPVSGLRVYEWNARTQRWEDETDSHDIEGLLTRDVMRFCSGIPLF